jgi:sulfatase maturation enzyme AslB (radical SAM superfamily)
MEVTAAFVKSLVAHKVPDFCEIELTLFENCNVSCAFCAHDKKSTLGTSAGEMLAKIPVVEDYLRQVQGEVQGAHLHLVGGELLQDRLVKESPHYLETYKKIVESFVETCDELNLTPQVFVVTNLLINEPHWLIEWLESFAGQEVALIVSYDSFGRPISSNYLKNLSVFKKYIRSVNVVATRPTLRKIVSGDKNFDYIYEHFPVFIDDFLPDAETEHLIPDDLDYLNYLEAVGTRFQKLEPYGPVISNLDWQSVGDIQFTTFNKCTILPDNTVTNYLWTRHQQSSFRFPVNYQDNSNMLYHFLTENQCLSCEYFNGCPLRCPVSWSWKNKPEPILDECVNKVIFKSRGELSQGGGVSPLPARSGESTTVPV